MVRCGFGIFFTTSASSFATDARTTESLHGLDPATRFDQVCDIEAMSRIKGGTTLFHPDRAITYAISSTKITGDVMEGSGGAFRSGGEWYQFSFTCRASPDRIKVLSFTYKIGSLIPRGKWEQYGLWR
jgi:Domain of Unknown Function (DUF930)